MKNITKTKTSYIKNISQINDEASLCFAEAGREIPFKIKRFYFIYDIETNAVRGKHAHKKTSQMIFCLKGKVKIILDNGIETENILLEKPNHGLLLDKMVWHEMAEFQKGTVLLIVASEYFDTGDYIRDYDEFLAIADLGKSPLKKFVEYFQLSTKIPERMRKDLT